MLILSRLLLVLLVLVLVLLLVLVLVLLVLLLQLLILPLLQLQLLPLHPRPVCVLGCWVGGAGTGQAFGSGEPRMLITQPNTC